MPKILSDHDKQVVALSQAIQTHKTHEIECLCCGETDVAEDVLLASFAENLIQRGWTIDDVPLCPDCSKEEAK